jgi:uroporphyrinogen decarboxylase
MTLQNDNFIRALLKQPVDRTPLWLMRQAGRYLPEYRAIREKAGSFMNLCQNPELACEVTLQPLERFDLDAAIIFSDILTIPDAMGLELELIESRGPVFHKPITSKADIDRLPIPDPNQSLQYVMNAISTTRKALDERVPLIGFSGSPWTLATYMVEGQSSKNFSKIKGLLYQDPKSLHLLLEKLSESVILYLNAQIEAGAQVVMLFDTWGGTLSPHHYREFSLHYMERILAGLTREHGGHTVPTIVFTKNGGHWLEDIAQSGCDAVGVDWTYDLSTLRPQLEGKVAIQGNLDPAALLGTKEAIKQEVERILSAMKGYPGHIFNLGHGIFPNIPPENVAYLTELVHKK